MRTCAGALFFRRYRWHHHRKDCHARPDKAAAVAEVADKFRDSNAAVLTEYRGLTVAQLKELRRSLSGNATYAVVKNTLTSIAAKEAGIDAFEADLKVRPRSRS